MVSVDTICRKIDFFWKCIAYSTSTTSTFFIFSILFSLRFVLKELLESRFNIFKIIGFLVQKMKYLFASLRKKFLSSSLCLLISKATLGPRVSVKTWEKGQKMTNRNKMVSHIYWLLLKAIICLQLTSWSQHHYQYSFRPT